MLLALKVTKVFGSDGSSNRMLKHAVHAIAASLTKLVNLSIQTPCDWKHLSWEIFMICSIQ